MHVNSLIPLQFDSVNMLAFWLHAYEIDIVHWGQANAKTVDDLWQELMLGECRLQECPIMRLVDVTNVLVQQNGLLLREVGQELRNGRVRHRDSLPAEKMLPGPLMRTLFDRSI